MPKMKNILSNILGIVILTLVFVVAITVPTLIIPVSLEIASRVTIGAQIFGLMLLASLLGAIALSINVKLSEWNGTKLIIALGLSFWGIEYFMAQIETFYFRDAFTFMTNTEILNIILRGAITTTIAVPLSVIIFGKRKETGKISVKESLRRVEMKSWMKKAPLFALFYIAIYLLFGYYVAWQFEAVRLFYSGSAEQLGLIAQIVRTMKEMPLFLPYHFIRGLLWVLFSIPVILMIRGRTKAMMSLMLIFSYHGFQIIMAQGIFPPEVLVAHTVETTISACIYGGLIGYMFHLEEYEAISGIERNIHYEGGDKP
jgi:hypothetical protein